MFYGQYTHTDEILERVREEFGFEDVHRDAVMEHIWIALGKLGVSNFLQDFDVDIHIDDGRGLMPSNVMHLEGIRDKASGMMLVPSKDIFIGHHGYSSRDGKVLIPSVTVKGHDSYDPVQEPNVPTELEVNYAFVTDVPPQGLTSRRGTIGYQLRGDYIYCELSYCILEMKYKGFPIWDDMTPKVPDTAKVVNFIVQYIGHKIAKKYWIHDKLSKDKYDAITQDMLFAQGEARNGLLTPDAGEMEVMRRMLMRLIPNPDQFSSGFKNLNQGERLR